nr:RNA-directed DNA polymerase, eukaryota, reverse transcriptase zinc-binding domain protein [Tanacetum cinerariifolium]
KLDSNINSGRGKDELIKKRLEIIHQIQKLDRLDALETAQKAKIKWAIDGDENTGFYHGIINKRRSIQNIRGIMVEGKWIDEPDMVKKEFLDHFTNRFWGIINEVQSAFIEDRQILNWRFILNEVMSWWSIIINGSPTGEFQFGRGLKQGDPLSPFLFLLVMESLHISFKRVVEADIFKGIKVGGSVNLSHMFYANDAVFVGEWSESNIVSLIHVLDCFHRVSRLKINLNKSKLMGIEVDSTKVARAVGKFGCLVLKTPFLYLGSYVGEICTDYNFGTILLTVLGVVYPNGRCKCFLLVDVYWWTSYAKILMVMIFLVIKFRGFNGTRVIKAIHEADGNIGGIPKHGSSSCWLTIINEVKVLEKKGIHLLNYMHMNLGNGFTTSFWDDRWCIDGRLKDLYPRVYALENHKKITVGEKLAQLSLVYSFRRVPRGRAKSSQVEELKRLIQPVILKQGKDSWKWSLSKSGTYSVASVRNLIDSSLLPSSDMKTRWISYIPNKVNVFAWKVMTNSLPTRFNISRHGIDIESISCVNCVFGVESTNHLFFTCNLAKQVSKLIARWWDISYMDIDSYDNWRNWIDNINLSCKNKLILEGIFLVMWWLLWNFRNKKIFEDKASNKDAKPHDRLNNIRCSLYTNLASFDPLLFHMY